MDNWILVFICILILVLYAYYPKIVASKACNTICHWIRKDLMFLPSGDFLFQTAWDGFIFFSGIIITLYISDATELVNMNTLWIIIGFFIILAILSTIRRRMQPKDEKITIEAIQRAVKDGIEEGVKRGIVEGIKEVRRLGQEKKDKE